MPNRVDGHLFAGRGLIIDSDGEVLASTSRQTSFVTVDIDLEKSAQAKKTYPRDVRELRFSCFLTLVMSEQEWFLYAVASLLVLPGSLKTLTRFC